MKNVKKLLLGSLLGVFLFSNSTSAFASGTYRFHAQRNYMGIYSNYGNCDYKNRSTTLYMDYLEPYLINKGLTLTNKWYNEHAWENDMTYSTDRVDDSNFFVWGGHGVDYTYPEAAYNNNESSCHFYNLNSYTNFHALGDHENRQANATWSEIRWGNQMDFAAMYTCNFLHTGGSSTNLTKIFQMFEGLHLMVGFASKMYINPDEAKSFGSYLQNNYAIKDAWINASQKFQYQIGTSPTVYASWAFNVSHELDKLTVHTDPLSYHFTPSSYARKYYRVAN